MMSNGGLRRSLNKASCRRSSDGMVNWQSLLDVRCVCNPGPQTMSRPGPRSGTRSNKCSRSLDQNNTCSSRCEGWAPSRRTPGKLPTRYVVSNTTAEALRLKQLQGSRSPSHSVGQYTLCASLGPHVSLCAALRPHALPVFQACGFAADWFSKLLLPIARPPGF